MAKVNTSASYDYKTLVYEKFNGVDFTTDPTLVNRRRSPDGLNMISDNGGNPVKRKGWKKICNIGNGIVRNIITLNDTTCYGCCNGNISVVKDYNGTMTTSKVKINGSDLIISDKNHTHIIDGNNVVLFADDNLFKISEDVAEYVKAYVPIVFIGKEPTGGGTAYEDVNLLTRERIEKFIGNGTSIEFSVSGLVDVTQPYTVTVDGVEVQATVNGNKFTLQEPPQQTIRDNVSIQYFAQGGLSNSGKICNTPYIHTFGDGAGKRYFVVEDNSNIVRYSELNDYTYFPDRNYIVVGDDSNVVQGFLPINSNLGVIKENSERESTLFFISPTTLTDSVATVTGDTTTTTTTTRYEYKVTSAAAGVGAISHNTFAVLNDEPLFLSSTGIYGIATNNATTEKSIRQRSLYINGKLTKEKNLKNAVACVSDGYYYLCINGNCYVIDGRQKTSDYSGQTSYSYECYFFNNIPATSLSVFDDVVFFGTNDGNLCKFKTEDDVTAYSDDDKPIRAVWSTKYDDDGYPQFIKTMQKKGSLITVKPYVRSSVDVYVEVDGNDKQYIGGAEVNINSDSFYKIDFRYFTFDTRVGPRDKYLGRKIKKYMRIKLLCENDKLEPFGIYSITKTFSTVKYGK